ncbi:MAG TPA: hypothetical protein IAD32_03435 [Candidatus Scatavimonas merdigallinarum]|uniref:DUF2116 family Zn-ribbon domain-containing protein n=1 Tax=Candidatus Scatavimonas merdigallinarum TaxID=2840914 RepID=A0A9D0ZH85_9FIRM|nr:hypothetical protein [Candidatus Scatavimonas merdigallinarum]
MKKCEYCAKEISYHEQYCSDACQQAAMKYYRLTRNCGRLFSICNILGLLAIVVGLFWMVFQPNIGIYIVSGGCLLLGILYFLLPFGTPDMIKKSKIKKTIKNVKWIACLLWMTGLVLLIAGFFFLHV